MKQIYTYWAKGSYQPVEDAYAQAVAEADSLLPDHLVIINIENLQQLDDYNDLKNRAQLAEIQYHTLKEMYDQLCETYNHRI